MKAKKKRSYPCFFFVFDIHVMNAICNVVFGYDIEYVKAYTVVHAML